MPTRKLAFAKIARPRLSGVFLRERLFRLIDESRPRPVEWVASPAGSGKTTLAASYLDSRELPCLWYQVDSGDGDLASFFYYLGLAAKAFSPRIRKPLPLLTTEYLQAIPVFTRRYFESLFHLLPRPSVVVFDNYQDAPEDSGFHEMMAQALEVIPEGIRVFVLSRAEPPPQFARLRANHHMGDLGWQDIRLTREESGELFRAHGHGEPADQMLDFLHHKTEGWAAGLVLLMAQAKTTTSKDLSHLTPQGIFDYFASEVFDRSESAIRGVLLATAVLRKIDPRVAERLTGIGFAGQILEDLTRNHYFTYKHLRTYQYHPLFREFLLARAQRELAPAEFRRIQRGAAALLEESDQFEESVELLMDAADWDEAERLVLKHAAALIAQGRRKTLDGWLRRLPGKLLASNRWALYWLGVCAMAFDPVQARSHAERAFALFKKIDDPTGLYLAWACIVETFVLAWSDFRPLDRWIDEFESIAGRYPDFPTPEIEARVTFGMFSALFWRQPQHRELPRWAERLGRIVMDSGNVTLRMYLGNNLVLYHLWAGQFSQAAIIVDALRKASQNVHDPLTIQWWWGVEASYSWMVCDHAACLAAISQGMELADKTGVHLLDGFLFGQGIYSALTMGDPAAAQEFLLRLGSLNPVRVLDVALYHYMASLVARSRGDMANALDHSQQSVRLAAETGCPFCEANCRVGLAVTLFDLQSREEAARELSNAASIAKGFTHVRFVGHMFGAWFAFQQGLRNRAAKELRLALAIGAEQGYMNFTGWRPEMVSLLCAEAVERGIETRYVRALVRKRSLSPPDSDQVWENWPWPLRIFTLGRFELQIDGRPMELKGNRRPIELLKALVSFGESGVSTAQLIDRLWPDAEGDAGYDSFKMAVSRLRRLLPDGAIELQDGTLNLNLGSVWTDVRNFERLAQRAFDLWDQLTQVPRAADAKRLAAAALSLTGKAMATYRGPFLERDRSLLWTISLRERLRSKFLRLTTLAGQTLETTGLWKSGVALYRTALEAENTHEAFYQRLMVCHQHLGSRADALAVYGRCRAQLAAALDVTPSPATEALRATLLR